MARSDLALAVSTAAAASFCLSRAPLRQSVLAGLGTLLLASSARYILRFLSGKHFVVPRKGAILVSGASSGIGRAAALALDAAGFTVFAGVRKDSDAERLKKERDSLVPVMIDVTIQSSVDKCLEVIKREMEERKIQLVGLVNNAGVSCGLPVELQPIDSVRACFEVNVFGFFRLTQKCIPLLRKAGKGSRIVNIGSLSATIARPSKGTYSATKASVDLLSDALRMEVDEWNISVSVVEPGFVKTRITEKQVGQNLAHGNLQDAEYNLYRRFFDHYESRRLKQHAKGSTTEVTSRAIVHAITSPYPETRYFVAKAGSFPAWVAAWLLWLLPDRVSDMIVMRKG